MDTVVTDVVSSTATKVSLNKHFLVGVAAGIAVSGGIVGAVKLKRKLDARRKPVVETPSDNN